jgi:hypothetical protein
LLIARQPDAAANYAQQAYELHPGDATVNAFTGFIYAFAGRATEGLDYIDRAISLERVPRFRAQDLFARLFIAYTAGLEADRLERGNGEKYFRLAYESYEQHIGLNKESGIDCINNCLAFAIASTRAIQRSPNFANDKGDQQEWASRGNRIAAELYRQNSNFPDQFRAWVGLYKDQNIARFVMNEVVQGLQGVAGGSAQP